MHISFLKNTFVKKTNMELLLAQTNQNSSIDNFLDQMKELNLIYYASDLEKQIDFGDNTELNDAVMRSMKLCKEANIPVDFNFKRIYKCSSDGIIHDWKLSILGYQLVCINGKAYNADIVQMQIDFLKNRSL